MTQLILYDGETSISLPESRKGGYMVYQEDLGQEIQMIAGNLVKEIRGTVWKVLYQYGYFSGEQMQRIISICEAGRKTPIICAFLGQDGEMKTSSFFVTKLTRPKFMWSRTASESGEEKTIPMWADFSVELREVDPHD